eukprot:6177336-Pleurochrysis_carterae.AAC.2
MVERSCTSDLSERIFEIVIIPFRTSTAFARACVRQCYLRESMLPADMSSTVGSTCNCAHRMDLTGHCEEACKSEQPPIRLIVVLS